MLSEQMVELITDDLILVMSDEANFHLSGYVNKHNLRYWFDANPIEMFQRPPHIEMWQCGVVTKNCVIGPYFFEEDG